MTSPGRDAPIAALRAVLILDAVLSAAIVAFSAVVLAGGTGLGLYLAALGAGLALASVAARRAVRNGREYGLGLAVLVHLLPVTVLALVSGFALRGALVVALGFAVVGLGLVSWVLACGGLRSAGHRPSGRADVTP